MGQDWLRREAYYQISHAVDFCLKIAEDNPKTNPAQPVQIGVSTNRRKSPSNIKYEKPESLAATSSAPSLDDLLTKPEDPPDPSDVLPEEDHVHFYKDPDGKPMVNGLLNVRPFSMLIDTGAHRTVVGKKIPSFVKHTSTERKTHSVFLWCGRTSVLLDYAF
jgi:hypothetical protein